MKYICKEDLKINNTSVGKKGDILEITDAIPDKKFNETLEDVKGYCDILNISTNQTYEATWFEVNCNLAVGNLLRKENKNMGQNSFVNDEMIFATIVEENEKFRAYFANGDIPYTKYYEKKEDLIHELRGLGFYQKGE